MSRIRVLLVDNNRSFLEGVAAWMVGEEGIDVVGKAHSGQVAIDQVNQLNPDLVLTDGTMPGMDGFEATRRIKSNPGAPLVVLMTFHDSEAARNEAWAAGADGFLAKADVTSSLLDLARDLVAGRAGRDADPRRRPATLQRNKRSSQSPSQPTKPGPLDP